MYKYLTVILFILYILAMTAVMIWQGIGIAPDRYFFILILGSLLIKRTRQFLLDWLPFLFILLAYDFLRGFADNLNSRVHYVELVQLEEAIFGVIPTIAWQQALFNPLALSWYDYMATVLYFVHFALPLGFGFLLWMKSRARFRQFVIGLVLLSYAGWITYIVYPAAPPWLAYQDGYIPEVVKIMDHTLNVFPERVSLPTIYHQFNPNQVAAIPSMHAAYPFFVFLFALSFFRKKALLFLPYVLAVWFSVVYLGEHYIIDVIIGAIYALIFFLLTKLIYAKIGYFKKFVSAVALDIKFR